MCMCINAGQCYGDADICYSCYEEVVTQLRIALKHFSNKTKPIQDELDMMKLVLDD